MKNWRIKRFNSTPNEIYALAQEAELSYPVAFVLYQRGYRTKAEIENFMSDDLSYLHSPLELKDMEKVCNILLDSIAKGEKIAVYGDYDADGITSTAILCLALKRLGANVTYYIPARQTEGYGLNCNAIDKLKAENIDLILTCDNGISAVEQSKHAHDLGMKILITDHHELPYSMEGEEQVHIVPEADGIINPKQPDCPYPFKSICAGMVSFKIVKNLYQLTNKNWDEDEEEYMALASIATVCDIMDLVDENRVMLRYILPLFWNTKNVGLRALLEETGLMGKAISVYHIGFILGPCINSSGRLQLADIAVNLFLENDREKAHQLAKELVEMNSSRKSLSNQGVEEVNEIVLAKHYDKDKVIVVHAPNLNESIAGIVAGKIKEKYYRPTFILTGEGEFLKGSGRSIDNFNMFDSLIQTKDYLANFGGHPMAAGLTIRADKLDDFRKAINENCTLTPSQMIETVNIDMLLPIEKVNLSLARDLQKIEPFGKENPAPVFGDKKVLLMRVQPMGEAGKVLRLHFASKNSKGTITAVLFKNREVLEQIVTDNFGKIAWPDLLEGKSRGIPLDIAYVIDLNSYNNREYAQIQVSEFRINKN